MKEQKGKSSSSLCMWLYNNQLSNSWLNMLNIFYNPLGHPLLITIMYGQCLIGKQSPQVCFIYSCFFEMFLVLIVTASLFQCFRIPDEILCMYFQMLPLYHIIKWLITLCIILEVLYSYLRKCSFRILIRLHFHVGSQLWLPLISVFLLLFECGSFHNLSFDCL